MRGEPQSQTWTCTEASISTHSPRAGRTYGRHQIISNIKNFNSLAPCGANLKCLQNIYSIGIFQLTRPVRGEPRSKIRTCSPESFQLTRPVRGEPNTAALGAITVNISTHSPRAGRTSTSCIFVDCSPLLGVDNNFCSRTDCGFFVVFVREPRAIFASIAVRDQNMINPSLS